MIMVWAMVLLLGLLVASFLGANLRTRHAAPLLSLPRPKRIQQPLTTFTGGYLLGFGLLFSGLSLFAFSHLLGQFLTQPQAGLLRSKLPLLLAGAALLFGLFFLISGGRIFWQALALHSQGRLTGGVLFDRWIELGRVGRAGYEKHYCVAYYFELPWQPRGSPPVQRAEYNRTAYHSLRLGDPVLVRYLPDNPKICRLEL